MKRFSSPTFSVYVQTPVCAQSHKPSIISRNNTRHDSRNEPDGRSLRPLKSIGSLKAFRNGPTCQEDAGNSLPQNMTPLHFFDDDKIDQNDCTDQKQKSKHNVQKRKNQKSLL